MHEEIYLELKDDEWPLDYIDHDRKIARAIVFDKEGKFYFIRVFRDDGFGKATLIETSGGGIEEGEDEERAVRRELKEELGVEVEIISKIGLISDYYNLVHRHNLGHYFLCKIKSFGETNRTYEEINCFNLQTIKLSYDEAYQEYERCKISKLGRLIANRELPVLIEAKKIIDEL